MDRIYINLAVIAVVLAVLVAYSYGQRSEGVEFSRSWFRIYRGISAEQKGASLWVLEDGEPLLELRDKRYMQFRATTENDHWLGTLGRPMDLCWDYSGVNDYEDRQVKFSRTPEGFRIEASGTKPSVEGNVRTIITATRREQDGQFDYTIDSKMDYSVAKWHQVSRHARRAEGGRSRLAPLNFHINRVSFPDIYQSRVENENVIYDGFVFSHDGESWTRRPKIHIPFVIRRGYYPTNQQDIEYGAGDYYGVIDREKGGWIINIEESSSPFIFGLCWMFFDIHHIMTQGIEELKDDAQRATAYYTLNFSAVDKERANRIWDNSQEVEWRSRREYQDLPLFSWHSRFDKLLTDEDVNPNDKYIWWPSSYDCFRDDSVGFEDNYSISIKLDNGKAAWYNSTWGAPYETYIPLSGAYRVSAMVKTENVEGETRLSVSFSDGDKWLRAAGWTTKEAVWKIAQKTLSGTNDWTKIEIEFDPSKYFPDLCSEVVKRTIVLEQIGPGQSWFDEVKIEKVH